MQQHAKAKTLIIAMLVYLATSLTTAQAEVMLNGELIQEFSVATGQQLSGSLDLTNKGNEPAEVKLYQEEHSPDGTNRPHGRSNKSWIHLTSDRVILPPGGRQQVPYTIQVPPNSGAGSYWSMIQLEPVSKQSRESQVAPPQTPNAPNQFTILVEQKVRYAVAVLTHIGNGTPNIIFSSPQMERDEQGQRIFGIDIQNTGNRHANPKITLSIFDNRGNSVTDLKGDSLSLVPGAKKRFVIKLNSLKPGTYKSLLSAEDKNSGKNFGVNVTLTVQP